jgi:predicted transcriptional regulator
MTHTRDLAKVTKAAARNATISKARLIIEHLLQTNKKPMGRRALAEAAGITTNKAGAIINNLLHEGRITHAGRDEDGLLVYHWRRAEAKTKTHPERHIPQPAKPGELMAWTRQPPARADANNHLLYKSWGK